MRTALIPTIATAIVALAGCGESSSGSLDKGELVRKADAICKDVNRRTNALPAATDVKSAARTLRETLVILGAGLGRLRNLKPPADLRDAYDAWLAKDGELIAQAGRTQAAAARGDGKGLRRSIADASVIHNEANKLAAEIGLKICSARQTRT